jgi:tight adherence protein B
MNRRNVLAAAAVLLMLLCVPGGYAGAAEATQLSITGVDTSHPGHATIAVSVPASLSGRPLPTSAWSVRESGELREVEVTGLPTDPAEVVLVMDTSGSMNGNALNSAQQAAAAFVDRMPPAVSVAVVGFGTRPYVASGFSTDRSATKQAIASLRAGGETAFYDALGTATTMFTAGTHHAVVALTDGKDTASALPLSSAVGRIETARASFDGIALTTAEGDIAAMGAIGTATGGRTTSADAPGALDGAYSQIASALTGQYRVAVHTSGSGSHEFTVSVRSGSHTATGSTRVDLPLVAAAKTSKAASPEAAKVTTAPDPGFWSNDAMLWLGLGVLFCGLAAGLALAFSPRTAKSQISGTSIVGVRNGSSVIGTLGDRATQLAERGLARRDRAGRLERALARAGIAMRPSELVVICAAATFGAFALLLVLAGFLPALVIAAAVPLVARSIVSFQGNRRSDRFQDQLEQTLPLMAGSLRAGFGLMQALDAVARESESPTSEEFHRLVVETRLGRDVSEAMAGVAERVDSEDFDWVVQAIDIHRQVGGDLAQVLDNVAATIRDRNRIRRQIKALSAEGRLSAIILFVLPFAMFGVISVLNPDYIGELTSHSLGIGMLVFALGLLTVGGLWLKRIVRLVF